ncbi:c-type cytochrome [Leptolyngbya iicbica]|uniref:c-type cytochrome n=1 Tax=Leptolyngbya iicbica TaxID=3161580 RepID=UPI000584D252
MADNALNPDHSKPASATSRWLLWATVAIACLLATFFVVRHVQAAADPYVQEVLALQGDRDRGQEIFQMNCAVCHGIEADGEVGPSLLGVSARKSKSKLIQQVVSGNTPPMPQFQPEAKDMADLLEYLEQL